MPELPDVEIARRDLQRWLSGVRIAAARTTDRYISRGTSPAAFARDSAQQKVKQVSRRGKWLRIELEDGARIFSHLGMTGSWARVGAEDARQRWERARLTVVQRGVTSGVVYIDSRRFGRLILVREDIAEWRELGPDPLADGIDVARLGKELARRRRAIKDVLMDQSVLAGMGNILVTEALWHARIDPRSASDALATKDVRAIGRAMQAELDRELRERAAAHRDKRKGNVREGEGEFAVYGRAGEPCPRCATRLTRIVLGGRGTTFCTGCQVRPARRAH